uniref:39S ribosomal protein L52, mitochondrial n=1 Tax=Angiostrongylus cantonensis TaxID=6313 RepID=A0A0K0DKB3_ANGCA
MTPLSVGVPTAGASATSNPNQTVFQRPSKSITIKFGSQLFRLQTLELIRQRGIARAADNRELASELAKQCRQAVKEDLKERRAAVMIEAAEAGKGIR